MKKKYMSLIMTQPSEFQVKQLIDFLLEGWKVFRADTLSGCLIYILTK